MAPARSRLSGAARRVRPRPDAAPPSACGGRQRAVGLAVSSACGHKHSSDARGGAGLPDAAGGRVRKGMGSARGRVGVRCWAGARVGRRGGPEQPGGAGGGWGSDGPLRGASRVAAPQTDLKRGFEGTQIKGVLGHRPLWLQGARALAGSACGSASGGSRPAAAAIDGWRRWRRSARRGAESGAPRRYQHMPTGGAWAAGWRGAQGCAPARLGCCACWRPAPVSPWPTNPRTAVESVRHACAPRACARVLTCTRARVRRRSTAAAAAGMQRQRVGGPPIQPLHMPAAQLRCTQATHGLLRCRRRCRRWGPAQGHGCAQGLTASLDWGAPWRMARWSPRRATTVAAPLLSLRRT